MRRQVERILLCFRTLSVPIPPPFDDPAASSRRPGPRPTGRRDRAAEPSPPSSSPARRPDRPTATRPRARTADPAPGEETEMPPRKPHNIRMGKRGGSKFPISTNWPAVVSRAVSTPWGIPGPGPRQVPGRGGQVPGRNGPFQEENKRLCAWSPSDPRERRVRPRAGDPGDEAGMQGLGNRPRGDRSLLGDVPGGPRRGEAIGARGPRSLWSTPSKGTRRRWTGRSRTPASSCRRPADRPERLPRPLHGGERGLDSRAAAAGHEDRARRTTATCRGGRARWEVSCGAPQGRHGGRRLCPPRGPVHGGGAGCRPPGERREPFGAGEHRIRAPPGGGAARSSTCGRSTRPRRSRAGWPTRWTTAASARWPCPGPSPHTTCRRTTTC